MATATPTISDLLLAHDAVEALTALGWPVILSDDDPDTWRIGYFVLTNDERIGLATRCGI